MTPHAVSFAERVPLHQGHTQRYFVKDCACGWTSPLCESEDAAQASFEAHLHREDRTTHD